MASLQMNKLKSKLTTRNQFTGRAMERMTKDTLRELFQGDLNYMSWEKTYIQRRFRSDEYVRQLREHRREAFEKQKKQTNTSVTEASELERILAEEEKHDDELQTRFQRFEQIHNGVDKTVLILDVDNTMVYVRFFSEEIEVGDVVTYFASSAVHKNNATVVAIRLTLILEIASSTLIDTIGAERLEHEYWATSNEALRKYKKKNGVFDYAHDAESFACKIRKVEVTGCRLQLRVDDDDEAVDDGDGAVEVDFTGTENVENLSRLEPMLERAGMSPVDFIYEGFLVRVRPNLDEFLEYCSDDYDVVIYTSANKLIYEGLLQVLHDYLVDQLGRDDESELRLWTDVLYRDDCTLDYDERGKPYHHKDLTLFGADLSRVIMVDNSPVVCRGEEPNLLLIRDYFGKDALDDELMELYQILDAMLDIEGDVRYFLCGLLQSSQAQQAVDTSTEEACWALTQQLMSALDAYYSQQIAFVGDGDEDGDAQVVDEGEDAMMDDYDEEDISQREKMFSQARVQQHKTQTQSETVAAGMDVVDSTKQLVVPPATLTLQHETSASVTVTAVDLDAGVEMDEMDVDIGDDDDDETDNDGSRPATTTAVSAASDTKTRKSVKFELPSLDTNAAANATLTLAQKGKSKSAKSSRSKSSRSKLSMSRHMSAHSSHTHNHSLRKSASRNKSLLLDPDKLTTATLSKRHAHYSSMSPKYAIWSFAHATKGYGPKLSDLDVNDAIHSFGAHDDDDDDDDEEQDPEMEVVREHHEQFFAKTANHAHTKSSLTIDAKLYSTRTSTNMRVPMFKVDLASDVLAMTKSESAQTQTHAQISPTLTATADGSGDKEDSVSTTMSLNHQHGHQHKHQHALHHSSGAASGMSDLDSDFFVPAANILKRSSMRTVHTIKAEQAQKRQKRLSQKHLFGHKQQQPQPQKPLLPMKQLVDARLRPLESYEHDKEPPQPQPKQHLQPNTSRQKSIHRRAISSDAIQEVDFSAMEMSASATATPTMTAMTATTERGGGRRRPRQAARPGRHKHSIHDTEQFGRIWKNTMAPRPSANAILLQSKHDEFIMLFQQQLAENKQQQLQRKQSHVRQAEKRNSVPDFAIFASLSEMESEADVTAHRERLSTLREEQLSGGAFGQSNTLQSLSEQVPQAQRTLSSRKEYASRFSETMSSKHKLLDSQTETKDLMHMERLRTDTNTTNTHRNHPHSNQEINATTTQWNENISSHHGCCYYLFCCCVCNLLCGRAPTHESSDTLDENLAHAPASLDLSQE